MFCLEIKMGLLIFFLFGLLSFAFGRERDSPYPYSLSLSPSLTFEWGLDYAGRAVEARVTYAPGPGSEGGDLVESGAITGMQCPVSRRHFDANANMVVERDFSVGQPPHPEKLVWFTCKNSWATPSSAYSPPAINLFSFLDLKNFAHSCYGSG